MLCITVCFSRHSSFREELLQILNLVKTIRGSLFCLWPHSRECLCAMWGNNKTNTFPSVFKQDAFYIHERLYTYQLCIRWLSFNFSILNVSYSYVLNISSNLFFLINTCSYGRRNYTITVKAITSGSLCTCVAIKFLKSQKCSKKVSSFRISKLQYLHSKQSTFSSFALLNSVSHFTFRSAIPECLVLHGYIYKLNSITLFCLHIRFYPS